MEIQLPAMKVQEERKAISLEVADWEMIQRALKAYSASLEPDMSPEALRERGFAIALEMVIGFEL